MADDVRALRRLASRALRPDTSRYAELAAWSKDFLESCAPHTPSARLWEALATQRYIPADWPGDRMRRFDSSRDTDLAWPPDIATALTLAADPVGVATVEVLLRDSWRMWSPGALGAPVIRWLVVPRERVQPAGMRPGRDLIVEALAPPEVPAIGSISKLFGAAREIVEGVFGTRRADRDSRERLSVPGIDPRAMFDGVAFEEVLGYDVTQAAADAFARDYGCHRQWSVSCPGEPNPFAPLRRIWELGYAVDEVTPHAIVVHAPEAPVPEARPWSRTVHVAGISFEGRPALLPTLAAGRAVRLEREPDNVHDRHAIRIVTAEGVFLGYVPRATAAALSAHLDHGGAHLAEIVRVDVTSPSLERSVFVEITETR